MKRGARTQLEQLRRESGVVENTLIDDYLAGETDRRAFLQRATMFGLSIPAIGVVLGAMGETPVAFGAVSRGKAGGRLRLGINPAPAGAIEPILFADTGSLSTGSVCGEFLTRASQNLQVKPELALSWTPNKDASEWTYKLRPNVKFQSGSTMTAADVISTYKRLLDPTSQALSASRACSPRGHHAGRRSADGRVQARRADRQLPVPDQLDDLPGDHPAGVVRPWHVHEQAAVHGPLPAHRLLARRRASRTSASPAGGAARRRSTASTPPTTRRRQRPTRPCSRAASTCTTPSRRAPTARSSTTRRSRS